MPDYFAALAEGAGNVLSWPNILIPVLGTLIAMVTSFLPGIGGASIATVALLMTLHWEPVSVLLLFGALTGGATFMGSVTAILFNIPGNSASAAAQLDGHALSRKGMPKTAIACAATASAVGSLIGVVVLLAILPMVRPFILQFGPLERLLLGIWGLSTIVALPNSSGLKAVAVTLLGLLAAMIGSDPTSGLPRWTFADHNLYDGFDMVAVLLGFFTLSEVISWRRRLRLSQADPSDTSHDSVGNGILSVFRHFGLTMRSSILGTVIGVIPGVGGTVASFVAYGQAVQTAKGDRSGFGQGDIRGLIAPEAAVDAKDGGSLLPTLAFGLPGSEAGVILLTVLMIHGFVPGLPMLTTELASSFTLILALLLSNLLTSALGVGLAPSLARLTTLPIDRIVLPVLVLSFVTVVQLNGNPADLYVAAGFGVLGYAFKHFDWPRIPFIIAFVLGAFIEENLALTTELARVGRIAPLERPAAMIIALLIVVSALWMVRKSVAFPRSPPRATGELALAFALGLAAAILGWVSLEGGARYSLVAQSIAWGTAGLCAVIGLRLALHEEAWDGQAVEVEGAAALQGAVSIPPAHRVALALMVALSPAVWLLGLPVATGLFSAVWLIRRGTGTRGIAVSATVGAMVALAIWIWLDQFAALLLPPPAILGVFGP